MKYLFTDFETTDLDLYTLQPLTGGFIICDEDLNELERFELKFKPTCKKEDWNHEAEKVHGISYRESQTFPSRSTSIRRLLDRLEDGGYVFVCHANINFFCKLPGYSYSIDAYFDWAVLHAMMVYEFGDFHWYTDFFIGKESTHTYANWLAYHKVIYPDSLGLADLCRYYGIENSNHHEAINDARICKLLYERLRKEDDQGPFRYSNREDSHIRSLVPRFRRTRRQGADFFQ